MIQMPLFNHLSRNGQKKAKKNPFFMQTSGSTAVCAMSGL